MNMIYSARVPPSTQNVPQISTRSQRHFQTVRLVKRRTATHVTDAYKASSSQAEQSYNMLDAFFIGRALAEVLNERLGSAAADIVSELGHLNGKIDRELKDIQAEVLVRARQEMAAATTGGTETSSSTGGVASITRSSRSSNAGSGSSNIMSSSVASSRLQPGTADVAEAADNLRAEVASARAVVQQLRQQQQEKQQRKK